MGHQDVRTLIPGIKEVLDPGAQCLALTHRVHQFPELYPAGSPGTPDASITTLSCCHRGPAFTQGGSSDTPDYSRCSALIRYHQVFVSHPHASPAARTSTSKVPSVHLTRGEAGHNGAGGEGQDIMRLGYRQNIMGLG